MRPFHIRSSLVSASASGNGVGTASRLAHTDAIVL
jgi:hypothetical protein